MCPFYLHTTIRNCKCAHEAFPFFHFSFFDKHREYINVSYKDREQKNIALNNHITSTFTQEENKNTEQQNNPNQIVEFVEV